VQANKQADENPNPQEDVCVLVWTHQRHRDDRIFSIQKLLHSLHKQNNPRWQALIFQYCGAMENAAAHARYTGCKTIEWIIHTLIDLDPPLRIRELDTARQRRQHIQARRLRRGLRNSEACPDLLTLKTKSRQTVWDHGQLELHVPRRLDKVARCFSPYTICPTHSSWSLLS